MYKSGRHSSGIYAIDPDGEGAMEVYCDQVSGHVKYMSERVHVMCT